MQEGGSIRKGIDMRRGETADTREEGNETGHSLGKKKSFKPLHDEFLPL